MRLTRWICVPMLTVAAACSNSVTAPPSGLSLSVFGIGYTAATVPSISSAGDSVVAFVVPLANLGCNTTVSQSAGIRGGDLIVTLTEKLDRDPCGALSAFTILQINVRDVPPGTRSARVVERDVNGDRTSSSLLVSGLIIVR